MTYGTIKVDTITFTDDGSDVSVSVSGLAKNPTISGNLTVTGNISGTVIQGSTTVSGATVTGTTANFISGVYTTQLSGATITGDAGQFTTLTGNTAGFTTVTGTTVTGTTGNFVSGVFTSQVSGATVTGNTGQFTTLTGGTAGFTTVTGTTVTGTTANFATVSGTTVTGNAGNFTTATVTSGVFASGTAGAPSVSVGTTDNGLYSPGTDQVALSTNGTEALRIDSGGNILVVDGNNLQIDEVRARDGDGLKLFDDGGAGIFVKDGGNVGIGSSSPSSILTTKKDISSATAITAAESQVGIISGSGSGTNFRSTLYFSALNSSGNGSPAAISAIASGNTNSSLAFYTNGANNYTGTPVERLRIDDQGRVGIGTTSVAAKLQVSVDNDHTDQGNTLAVRGTSGSWAAHLGATSEGGALVARGNVSTLGSLIFGATNGSYASYTERARIDSSGRLLVGTSSDSGGALLQVNDNRIRVATAKTPASASDTGTTGEICWDASYIYVCTATNTWKRAALSTW